MKGSRFTETQIIAILKEAESGMLVKDVCRKHGISDATYYNLRRHECFRSQADERDGNRTEQPEAHICRHGVGKPGAQGSDRKKAVRLPRKRETVHFLMPGMAFPFNGVAGASACLGQPFTSPHRMHPTMMPMSSRG